MRHTTTALLLALCSYLHAYDVEVDGIYYGIVINTAYVTHRGLDNMESGPYVGDIIIPEEITYKGKTYPVSVIGESAFAGCDELTSVTLPPNVRGISPCAFIGCTNLKRVTTSAPFVNISEFAFTGCTSLQEITLPRRAERINELALYCCSSLKSLILPHRTRSILYGALEHIPNVTDLYCFASEPPETDANAFTLSDQQHCTLHVPRETIDLYRQEPVWSNFYRIVPLTDSEYQNQGYVKGDVNDDGHMDEADLQLLRRIIVHLPDDSAVRWAADINGDGIVNAIDYVTLAGRL